MKRIVGCLMAIGLLCFAAGAHADSLNFTGNIDFQNEVAYIDFLLWNDVADVSIWTDSYNLGYFDPNIALWDKETEALIGENDDDPAYDDGQFWYDSRLTLASLEAGKYTITVAAFGNFAYGPTPEAGCELCGESSVPIEAYWTKGTGYYSVWVDLGTPMATPVPIPGAVLLLGPGLLALGAVRRKLVR